MAFKNAFKIFVHRFGLMWSLVLFLLFFVLILISLGLTIILPVFHAFQSAGIADGILGIFNAILSGNAVSPEIGADIQTVWSNIMLLFQDNKQLTANSVAWFFVIVAAYKFFLGFYELPMYGALEGAMSSNAKLRYMTCFVSNLGKSSRFVLVKIIYTTLLDSVFYLLLYFMLGLFFIEGGIAFALIAIGLFFVVFQSIRYTFLAFWGPSVSVGKMPVFKGFGSSFKKSLRHFPAVFFSFFGLWTIILSVNLFIGIFTFGIGLLATVPASMFLVCILNMTLYYGKTGKRYYADGEEIVTPPNAEI